MMGSRHVFDIGLLTLTAAILCGCAPLTHSLISLDGSDTESLSAVSVLSLDSQYPLILRGLDGTLLPQVRVSSAFRTWSFVLSPGRHLLWASSVPYGLPLIPQFLRCYAIDVWLEPGSLYILRHDAPGSIVILIGTRGTTC